MQLPKQDFLWSQNRQISNSLMMGSLPRNSSLSSKWRASVPPIVQWSLKYLVHKFVLAVPASSLHTIGFFVRALNWLGSFLYLHNCSSYALNQANLRHIRLSAHSLKICLSCQIRYAGSPSYGIVLALVSFLDPSFPIFWVVFGRTSLEATPYFAISRIFTFLWTAFCYINQFNFLW